MRLPAVYSIVVGSLIAIQWVRTLVADRVPNPDEAYSGRGRLELGFHWVAEAITATGLIASGASVLGQAGWSAWLFPLSLGMLIYTLINSSGYFAQRREFPVVAMFGILLAGAVFSLIVSLSV